MPDSFDPASASRDSSFLWVNLTREARTALAEILGHAFDIRQVGEPRQISGAIQVYAPPFVCFEFEEPDAPGIDALAHTRHEPPPRACPSS